MIEMINSENTLIPFLHHKIEDEGKEAEVDSTLKPEEYIGIKVDDYYNTFTNPPKSVDFIVAVDCSCDSFVLYIIEFKNVKSPNYLDIKAIHEKFETTINDFMKNKYNHIFCNDKFKYKDIKLFLISDAYGVNGRFENHTYYREHMEKMNKKDSLKVDNYLGEKIYKFRNKYRTIQYDIPPNPIIQKIV